MAANTFSMHTQQNGRIKYLLLTMFPALALMYLFQYLTQWGILPGGSSWGLIYTSASMAVMLAIAYFLIFQKNHQINIKNDTIVEINWQRKESRRITSAQIHAIRRNFLNEIILLDQDGKKLLCIESNMSNFDQFEQWLVRHNIH